MSAEEEQEFARAFDEADWSFIDLPNMDDHVHVAKYFEGNKECMGKETLVVHIHRVRIVCEPQQLTD